MPTVPARARQSSFYRCPSSEVASSRRYLSGEVTPLQRDQRRTGGVLHNVSHSPPPSSPTAAGIRMAFPRAYSSISHDQMLRQASTYLEADSRRRWRAHSPEVDSGTPRVHARVMPQSPGGQPGQLPRAWSAVTWCSSGLHNAQAQVTAPPTSLQMPKLLEPNPTSYHLPQPPKAVVVQGHAQRIAGFAGLQSPRPRLQQPRLISSPPQSPPRATSSISALVGCSGPDRKARASGPGQGQSTSRSGAAQPMGSAVERRSSEAGEAEDAPEFSIPSTDLDGLLRYLQGLCHRGLRITEVTYCVNSWNLYGLIPLKHHGFILFTKGCRLDSYLTLDFSSRGILWDTFDTYPDVPEGTFFAKTYKINLDPLALREYCKDTEPFSWPHNDCKKWAKGMLRLMGIKEDPDVDGAIDKLTRGNVRLRDIITCGGGTAPNATRLIGCMQ